jgi:hypothetical protein
MNGRTKFKTKLSLKKLVWSKDNVPLMASTRFTVDYEPITGEIDVFFNYVKNVDTGPYKCKAENIYGSDVTEATLFIIDGPNIDERPQTVNPDKYNKLDKPIAPTDIDDDLRAKENLIPPRVKVPLSNVRLNEGDTVFLSCKIDAGYPRAKVIILMKNLNN